MNCSPSFRGEPRQDVGNRSCDNTCFYWKYCLEELGLPDDFDCNWVESLATGEDLKIGRGHAVVINNIDKYYRNNPKFKEYTEIRVWKNCIKSSKS